VILMHEPKEGLLPESVVDEIRRYVGERIKPGEFLTAVLESDLMSACAAAACEPEMLRRLGDIVGFLYEGVPGHCWGSKEVVRGWLDRADLE